ncbi:putative Homeobox domain, Chromo domain, SAWADEE domain-containing protein [Rosa chinensis]|uniref:Putative Homeobox domain, Chromo domain, SAWADEE domain-containing protein n=1 Tax=Rosa chinensis TaxID=74649 RepID=A0A2P6RXC7_ROSCH|nr:protein SAWADEE HOMEODOMAIN HOMOLOG 1 isoform X1 [Rosa chinensis]PRQ51070.1 putative Homeobox domain, Chromo domain, SAWADEE domain-containing protein [Rosa chinensis]
MKDSKLAKNLHRSETMERKPMNSLSVFTNSEIMKMENIFKETPQQSLTQEFFQNLATNFSCQPSRVGKSDITRQQVEGWFQSKRKEIQAKGTSSSGAFDWVVESHEDLSDLTMFSNAPDNSQKPKDPCVTDLSELAFEAKSSKDGAWYDVASFLSYRVVSSGELEVRVRYAGFGREEDEWVNVRRAVRDRSIPLEESECHKVKVGDLVLCFQEREDEAVYCDAHVLEIERSLHDQTGCRCIFVVRFDHDKSKEQVSLGRLCCRPSQYTSSAIVKPNQDINTKQEINRDKDMKFSFLY